VTGLRRFAVVPWVPLCVACGGSVASPDAAPIAPDAPPAWFPLISETWTAEPGGFDYVCRRFGIQFDMNIVALRPLAPPGTHHTLVTIANDQDGLGGAQPCEIDAGTLDHQVVFSAGALGAEVRFPEGVSLPLRAGQLIELKLHLFNGGEATLSGESGVEIQLVPAADVEVSASMTFSGTFDLAIPGNGQPQTASGGCTLGRDYEVTALWPHMHQLGTRQRVTLQPGGVGNVEVLLDETFAFSEAPIYPLAEPLALRAGDVLTTTCTYVNDTGASVGYGETAADEACLTGFHSYPATDGEAFDCTTGVPP
jgi:hypothetical protein